MPSFFQRHPRYSIFSGVALLVTFLLLASQHAPPGLIIDTSQISHSEELQRRLDYSEQVYQKMLNGREQLIRKYGPTRDKVLMFPPDKEPWPPYTVWDFVPPAFNCPHSVERIGALGDGGKWVCGLQRVAHKPDCVVYSFGINYESSFEAEILSRTSNCEVWGYDFSVKSFGPEVQENTALLSRAHFFPYGLAGTNSEGEHKMFTLQTLMQRNGHKHIDILKIDIESWEFETLTSLIKPYLESGEPLPFGQLQLEVHGWNKKFEEFLSWWEALEAAGLRPFWTEANLVYINYNHDADPALAEYSFLNIRGDNAFISDHDFYRPRGDAHAHPPPAPRAPNA